MSAARSLLEPSAWPANAAANDDPGSACVLVAPWAGDVGPFASVQVGTASVHEDLAAVTAAGIPSITHADDDARIVRRLAARSRDGEAYPGDLWTDILDYRALRMRELGGVHLAGAQLDRIAILEQRLRTDDRGRARQYERYLCRAPVSLSLAGGDLALARPPKIAATIADLSAGGAKLELSRAAGIFEGSQVDLWIEDAGGPDGVALPARVIWSRTGELGVMFAGAPRRARGP
jgi:hypothetical protein